MTNGYTTAEPSRAEINAMQGPLLLEFGDAYCGFCRAAKPAIEKALADRPDVRHLKIVDSRGRSLGRSFGIKLWPTLVFLMDGKEIERVVRPTGQQPVAKALQALPGTQSVA